jgi:hypothetical protein
MIDYIFRLVWAKQLHSGGKYPDTGDALLDVYLTRPESAFTSCRNVQRISDHCGVLLEVEWGENCRERQMERIVPVYQKTNVKGLQRFLRSKFASWASNGSCVKEIWKSFKEIVLESIYRFFQHKILSKNSDSEYYNKEGKRLKLTVRRVYNKRKSAISSGTEKTT